MILLAMINIRLGFLHHGPPGKPDVDQEKIDNLESKLQGEKELNLRLQGKLQKMSDTKVLSNRYSDEFQKDLQRQLRVQKHRNLQLQEELDAANHKLVEMKVVPNVHPDTHGENRGMDSKHKAKTSFDPNQRAKTSDQAAGRGMSNTQRKIVPLDPNKYLDDWVQQEIEQGKTAERARWAMFHDDGSIIAPIKQQLNHNKAEACGILRAGNHPTLGYIRDRYRSSVKHVPIWKDAHTQNQPKPRILCWLFTHAGVHLTKADTVRQTWGHKCDGLLFFSNMDDPDLPAVKLDVHNDFGNLWHKMQIAIVHLNARYGTQYDWFYKADDDTFAIIENLRRYLDSEEIREAQANHAKRGIFVGRRMNNKRMQRVAPSEQCMFNGGGPGYLFDRNGLATMAGGIGEFMKEKRTHSDDLMLGCAAEAMNITIIDTRDKAGGERFHVFDPEICNSYQPPLGDVAIAKAYKEDWYFSQTTNPLGGLKHCSPESVAFHHLSPQMLIFTYLYWYQCPDLH